MSQDQILTWAEIAESLAAVVGIVAAGIWAWFHFRRKRERYPRTRISHTTATLPLDDGRVILRVFATVANSGDVLVALTHAFTRVQQFAPVPENIQLAARDCPDPVAADQCELDWPMIGQRDWNVGKGLGEIEPGECETLCSDFVLPREIEKVLVYSYVTNHAKASDIGWSDTTIVSVRGSRDG